MKMTCKLTRQEKIDLLTQAFEGADIGYWGEWKDWTPQNGREPYPAILSATLMEWQEMSGDTPATHTIPEVTITSDMIEKGINYLLNSPKVDVEIKKQILSNDHDAASLDALVQASIYGEIKYG